MFGISSKSKWAVAALCATALTVGAQEANKYRVYGYIDAAATWRKVNNGYTQNYLGQDTLGLNLTNANIYFDWNPNDKTQALIEVALVPRAKQASYSSAKESAIIRYNGNPVTNEEIYTLMAMPKVIAGITAQVEAAVPEGTPNRDAIIQGQVASILQSSDGQAAIAAGEAQAKALLEPALMGLRSSKKSEYTNQRVDLNVERAYFNLLVNDQFNVRVGKWITPSGIWNVDHGSPVVLTVSQPYETTITPIFPEAQMGVMSYGSFYLGDHDLQYNAWISNGRSGASQAVSSSYKNSIDGIDDFAYGGHVGLKLDLPAKIKIGATAQTGNNRVKYAVNTLDIDVMQLQTLTLSDFVDVHEYVANERESILGSDLRIDFKNAFLQGEINYSFNQDNDDKDKTMEITGFYGLMGYKIPVSENLTITPYAMYEQVSWERGVNSQGFDLHGFGANGFHSAIGGLNFSLFSNVSIKAEYNYVQIMQSDAEVDKSIGLKMGFKDSDLGAHIVSLQTAVAF